MSPKPTVDITSVIESHHVVKLPDLDFSVAVCCSHCGFAGVEDGQSSGSKAPTVTAKYNDVMYRSPMGTASV